MTSGCRFKPRQELRGENQTKLVDFNKKDGYSLTKDFRFEIVAKIMQGGLCIWRMSLLNIFDLIDLNGDGTLSRDEFDLYNQRTGDDRISDEEWTIVQGRIKYFYAKIFLRKNRHGHSRKFWHERFRIDNEGIHRYAFDGSPRKQWWRRGFVDFVAKFRNQWTISNGRSNLQIFNFHVNKVHVL